MGLFRVLSVYGVLVIVGLVGAVGDATVNQWVRSGRVLWWFVSCAIWIAAATLFGFVLWRRHFAFSIAVILALLVHSAAVLVIDRVCYSTKLTGLQWLGIVLAVVANCLMEIGKQASDE